MVFQFIVILNAKAVREKTGSRDESTHHSVLQVISLVAYARQRLLVMEPMELEALTVGQSIVLSPFEDI